uniref:Putative secreted protein n=1 Tax=Rhipicephalus microplus TaxID=6941 RepID=A0A6M2DCL6_RHIMP
MCGALLWCFLCSLAVTNPCICLPCNSTFYLYGWHLVTLHFTFTAGTWLFSLSYSRYLPLCSEFCAWGDSLQYGRFTSVRFILALFPKMTFALD